MSLFDRFRGWVRGDAPAEKSGESGAKPPAKTPDEAGAKSAATAPAPPSEPECVLALAQSHDDRTAIQAFETIVAELGEARALAEARRALVHASLPALRVRVARTLDARGDDEAVEAVLSRMPETADVSEALILEAWARRAEVAERRNDRDVARTLWERVLSRDVTYPRAKERVAQLRGGQLQRSGDGGATVMAEGALTRGRYRVVRELGRGGAGTVFLAKDVGLDRDVALKVYHRRGRVDRERLLHEARVPATLEHPGVVRVLDVDLELFAIAMELTDSSVKDAARGGVELSRVLGWARSLAESLAWIHARGLVHRDLKPSNLLLRRDRVVLTDFGLAGSVGARDGAPMAGPEPSVGGGGEGTAGYMPIEQRRGDPAAFPMDVHALGVSLDEMLGWTGTAPSARPAALVAMIAAMRAPDAASRPTVAEVRSVLEPLA
ncbi:MAG: serine/threonine protein kinase [Sandaracinaceae bacterium]|nr:serine/threonine protein kinase [Sandaracinaceae bacterium]